MVIQNQSYRNVTTVAKKEYFAPELIEAREFAAVGADVTIPVGTVIAFDTSVSKLKQWVTCGANALGACWGVVYPEPIALKSAGEVYGQVIIRGKLDRRGLVSGGGTAAQLSTALRDPEVRKRGLDILHLDLVQ